MLDILWFILNIAAAVAGLYILYKSIVLVRKNMSMGAAILLVIVYMGMCSKHDARENNKPSDTSGRVTYEGAVRVQPGGKIVTWLCYDPESNTEKFSNSFIGFSAGISYDVIAVYPKRLPQNINDTTLKYEIIYTKSYKLLGIKIFTTSKHPEGTFTKVSEYGRTTTPSDDQDQLIAE